MTRGYIIRLFGYGCVCGLTVAVAVRLRVLRVLMALIAVMAPILLTSLIVKLQYD